MAALQYVGARYVPVFYKNPNGSWDWEPGVTYEPLTIVKYGENTYTSRMIVPATVGTPNLNPEYWANTGNYNGAITHLQEEINAQARNLLDFKQSYMSMSGWNVLILGDSYATVRNGIVPWSSSVKDVLSSYGASVTVIGVGGAGFIGAGPTEKTFSYMLENAPKSDYNLIIVQGFVNDFSTIGGDFGRIETAFESFLNTLNRLYAGVRTVYINPSKSCGLRSETRDFRRNWSRMFSQNGCEYAELSPYYLYSRNLFQDDLVHPTDLGQRTISKYVLQYLANGYNYLFQSEVVDNAYYFLYGDQVKILLPISKPITFPNPTLYNHGDLPFLFGNNFSYRFSAVINVHSTWKPAFIRLSAGKVTLECDVSQEDNGVLTWGELSGNVDMFC